MYQPPWMNTRIAKRLVQKKKLLDEYRPLPPFTVQRLHEDLRVLLTYHSNAIEGNTLSLAETQMVLTYGVTVNGHPLREFLEATNHAEAFDALTRLATNQIAVDTVLALHRLVMDKIDDRAGELRTVQVYIRGADFIPPLASDVPLYLEQWVRWLTSEDALQDEPVTRAAIAHHDFEALHPFTDGNGRVDLYLGACVESTAHLLLLQELAREFSVSVDYLGQLARKGKIQAIKRRQYWYASREAVQRYLAEADTQPRGRPRKDH